MGFLKKIIPVVFLTGQVLFLSPMVSGVWAHCDTMGGPVVQAAQKALETGNINRVLIWVRKPDEAEIRSVFNETLSVRKLNPRARRLADRYFFETVVRVHRAGEGAPYTGLKPAGTDLGPAIPCADRALEEGGGERLIELMTGEVKKGVREHFERVMEKRKFDVDDVAAGREYVEAYVLYMHYVERLYEAASSPIKGHHPGSGGGLGPEDDH